MERYSVACVGSLVNQAAIKLRIFFCASCPAKIALHPVALQALPKFAIVPCGERAFYGFE